MKKLWIVLGLTLLLVLLGCQKEQPAADDVTPQSTNTQGQAVASPPQDTPVTTPEPAAATQPAPLGTECGSVSGDVEKYCKCSKDLEENDGKLYCNGECTACKCFSNGKAVACS